MDLEKIRKAFLSFFIQNGFGIDPQSLFQGFTDLFNMDMEWLRSSSSSSRNHVFYELGCP